MHDTAERIALGFRGGRTANAGPTSRGTRSFEIDGLLLAFANVPDPPVNATLVISEPRDPAAALRAAEKAFRERGRPFGLDVAVGRHPSVDRAIREVGLTRLFAWPGMAVRVAELPDARFPEGVRVEAVVDERGAAAIARVEQAGFGSEPEIAERFYAAASYGVDGARSFVAWEGGRADRHGRRVPARGRDRHLRRRRRAGGTPARDRDGALGDRGAGVPGRPGVAPHVGRRPRERSTSASGSGRSPSGRSGFESD